MSLNDIVSVLSALGILPAIQVAAVSITAIFVYRYFTDRS